MTSSNAAESLPAFRSPTAGDIPGLLPSTTAPAPPAPVVQPDYTAARSMLDFIDRMSERLRPGAQRFIQGLVPEIRETYRAMHVALDRTSADLDEVRSALALLAAGTAPERAAGDGAVTLRSELAAPGEPLDDDLVEAAYAGILTLAERLGGMGSERLVEAIETIELGFLALESAYREQTQQLAQARERLAQGWAKRATALPGPDDAPPPPGLEQISQFGLTPDQVSFFEENGYVGPITLSSPQEMARIRRWIDRAGFLHTASPIYASGSPRGSAEARDWHLIYPEVHALCTHPAMVAVMEALLGPDLLLWRSQFMRKEAGAPALAWHQDGSFPGGKMIPALNPVKTVSAWLAIDSAQVDNGCVWVVPGSHKGELEYERREASKGQGLFHRGFEVQYAIPEEQAVPMVLEPGQFMVFDCQTLHGSSHNPSPWRRLGLAARYTSADVRVYEGQDVDGQGYALDRFGCVLVAGEDRYGHNVMAQAPKA
ncbi:MAG: phytanoyl-CoA dioxygenase family protein [Pseudomonadota bacterium]